MKKKRRHTTLSLVLLASQFLLLLLTIPHFHSGIQDRCTIDAAEGSGHGQKHHNAECALCVIRASIQADAPDLAAAAPALLALGTRFVQDQAPAYTAVIPPLYLRGPPSI